MNLITHLPCVSTGYDLVCTIVDWLWKYVCFVLCAEAIFTEGLSQLFLHTIIARHGMLCRVILDCDPSVYAYQNYWDVLLPLCKFALNSTFSASSKQLLAFIVFGHEPNLPLKVDVCDMTDSQVQAAIDCVMAM